MRLIALGLLALIGCASSEGTAPIPAPVVAAKPAPPEAVTRDNFCRLLVQRFSVCAADATLTRGIVHGALISEEAEQTYEELPPEAQLELDAKGKEEMQQILAELIAPEFGPRCEEGLARGEITQERYDFAATKMNGSCEELGEGVFLFRRGIVGAFQFSG